MKKETKFYIFLALFLIIVTGLRAIQINVIHFNFGEISPLFTTVLFILLIKKDSFKLICFNSFNYKVLIVPSFLFLLIFGVDFFIQLQLNLIQQPVLSVSFFIKLAIQLIIFVIIIGACEEVAWRGYLISKIIQNRLSWNCLIIVISIMWSIWHLPTHFYKFENHLFIQYPLFIMTCFELSIIMTYLRLKTNSVIPAIIIHSLVAIVYESFFRYYDNIDNYFYLTFPSITMMLLLFPVALYYYKQGGKLYMEQIGIN